MRFVDTNVLLYAVSTDPREQAKSAAAAEILSAGDLALSIQVLQEFFVQATRASRSDKLSHQQAAGLVESFLRFEVQETTSGLMLAAMGTRQRFGIPYWDAAILEAARIMKCDTVLSEDLGSEQDYGGVSVINPFLEAGKPKESP